MSLRTYCDRCDSRIADGAEWMFILQEGFPFELKNKQDLCSSCADLLKDWLAYA